MQRLFIKYLYEKFDGDLNELNHRFGLDYWSNRINSWEDFPDVTATITSPSAANSTSSVAIRCVPSCSGSPILWLRNTLMTTQFITPQFRFRMAWLFLRRAAAVDHFKAATAVDITGVDIYHPTEDDLTGKEIAFGGDMTRSTKDGKNFLVLETEAQGTAWLGSVPGTASSAGLLALGLRR